MKLMRNFGKPALGYSLWESGDWKYLIPFYGLKDVPEAVEDLEEPEYLIPGYGLKDLPNAVNEILEEPDPFANVNTSIANMEANEILLRKRRQLEIIRQQKKEALKRAKLGATAAATALLTFIALKGIKR